MFSDSLHPYLWSGFILILGAVWAFMIGVLKRIQLLYEDRREQRWKSRWKPALKQAASRQSLDSGNDQASVDVELTLNSLLDTNPDDLPAREKEFLLREWNQLMNRLDPGHYNAMIQFARTVGLPETALGMATKNNHLIRRIEGLMALGFMDHPDGWELAREAAGSEQPYLSIVGVQTLVRLDEERGISYLLDEYESREAFPPSQALTMLKRAPRDVVTGELIERFERAEGKRKVRLAVVLEAGAAGSVRPVIHRVLEQPDSNPELIARLLHVLGTFGHPDDEPTVVGFVDHPVDHVRVQSVKTLGKIGTSRSAIPLLEALGDSDWWVRYRAAQALTSIPDCSLDWLKDAMTEHNDPYARDMMERVMVEKNLI